MVFVLLAGAVVVQVWAWQRLRRRLVAGDVTRLGGLARYGGWALAPAVVWVGGLLGLVGLEEVSGAAIIPEPVGRVALPTTALLLGVAGLGWLCFSVACLLNNRVSRRRRRIRPVAAAEPQDNHRRLTPGDRIRLHGGYDRDPPWLQGRDHHFATVLGFFDNQIEGRTGDERLSAAIEFDEPVAHGGMTGRFGFLVSRWEGQRWNRSGVVHVHLADRRVETARQASEAHPVWAESHASYEVVDP